MWIVRKNKKLFNFDLYKRMELHNNSIEFIGDEEDKDIITFENASEAELQLKYIIEALKRKDGVINI